MYPSQCPFNQSDFELFRQELLDMPLQKLISVSDEIMDQLTPVEMINYNISKFVHEFSDKHGRIAWIRKLIDDGIIVGLQFPHDYYKNPRMVSMMQLPEYRMQFPFGNTAAVKGAVALTDDLVVVSGPVTIKNPRWEHTDKVMIEHSPNVAMFGDKVMLMADVTGVPEGALVMFDIYDTSDTPPMVIDSARGRNEKGVANGTWKVSDKSGKGAETKLEFEGCVKSKLSGRAPIKLGKITEFEFTLYIDPADPTAFDDQFILKGIDSDYEQVKTVRDDKVPGDGMLTIAFTEAVADEKYTLIHNDGQEQHIIIEETVYGG